jgi:hypothetical protein
LDRDKIMEIIEDDRIRKCEICGTVECEAMQFDKFPPNRCCFHTGLKFRWTDTFCHVCIELGKKRVGSIG